MKSTGVNEIVNEKRQNLGNTSIQENNMGTSLVVSD